MTQPASTGEILLTFGPEAEAAVKRIAELRGGCSPGRAVSGAIGTYEFLAEAMARGDRILLRRYTRRRISFFGLFSIPIPFTRRSRLYEVFL